jgi:DNA-binding LytR/AlgR family response regulator
MINAIVIEDEKPALENLLYHFQKLPQGIEIKAVLPSVEQAVNYLRQPHQPADLIFSDVQLTDGLSFQIFEEVPVQAPVIFITGYDRFMLDAFASNGIDYLLKPVNEASLNRAIQKFQQLRHHFSATHYQQQVQRLNEGLNTQLRSRLLVKRGAEYIPLKLSEAVLFYTDNKIVYVLDKAGSKYLCDQNLSELELALDPKVFFRANRKYIINLEYIRHYKACDKVKLQVELDLKEAQKHSIIVSQETAPAFRKWIMAA